MKKLLTIILCLCMIFSLAACGKKKQGPQGEPGKDGITPTIEISDDGYWVINGEKTEVKATTESDVSTSDENPYGLEFEMSDYTYIVSMCETTSENIVIPETYKGRAVVGIKDNAFHGLVNIKSVTIPDTVTSIGSSAFEGCTSLTGVTIPDSVTSIGSYAFSSCTNLTSVTIGNGVTSIGELPFDECTSLTSIDVDPDNAYYKSIDGNLCNKDGKTLIIYAPGKTDATFSIPDGVTSISGYAFYGCTSLTGVTIPDSVTSISSYAFYGCSSLTSIDVDPNNAYYKSIDGNLYNKDGKTLIKYAPGKTDTAFSILDGVTSIGSYAFSGCTSLANVTIPDSVTSINYYAFAYCSSLASVIIPDSVTYIDYCAFAYCSSLSTINYRGTQAQWNAIYKYSNWDSGTGYYTIVYNYNG